jgi:L-asparaginase II
VVDAMRAHPDMVGGSRRDVTAFMRAVPGLVVKDGAEGVYVAALADGRAIAIKADDGSARGRQVALAAILLTLAPAGADVDALASLASIPTLGGGHGVGAVTSPLAPASAAPA